jgi:hypothetical protein
MYIYGLTEPKTGEIRYIGKTIRNPERRYAAHLTPSSLKKTDHRACWLKSLLARGERPGMIILRDDIQLEEQLDQEEIELIAFCRSLDFRLVNLNAGGEGQRGRRWTPEQRERASRNRTGRQLSPATRQKISAALRIAKGIAMISSDGRRFCNGAAAARALGIGKTTACRCAKSGEPIEKLDGLTLRYEAMP